MAQNPLAGLAHVTNWVFDLDNTLYPSQANLFAQVDDRMTRYFADLLDVEDDIARRVQKDYYAQYGTSLRGLMTRHDIDVDHFLHFVHDIDLSALAPCTHLRRHIDTLPGRKFVFTNGSMGHAERVVEARGLTGIFDGLYDIAAGDLLPKPDRKAYERFLERFDIDPNTAAMFEDLPRNLEAPHQLGMATVLIRTAVDWSHEPVEIRPAGLEEQHDHVHHCTTDLTDFLSDVHDALGAAPTNT